MSIDIVLPRLNSYHLISNFKINVAHYPIVEMILILRQPRKRSQDKTNVNAMTITHDETEHVTKSLHPIFIQ